MTDTNTDPDSAQATWDQARRGIARYLEGYVTQHMTWDVAGEIIRRLQQAGFRHTPTRAAPTTAGRPSYDRLPDTPCRGCEGDRKAKKEPA